MATWRDFKPIFYAKAAKNGWKAADADFGDGPCIDEGYLPCKEAIFRALEEIKPSKVRFLIMGKDPYSDRDPAGLPHATGIAFAVEERSEDVPRPLNRIMKAVYGRGPRRKDLCDWRREHGILLLNAALTVPGPSKGIKARDVAGLHLPFWRRFTTSLVMQVRKANAQAKLIAWGADARNVFCDALERSEVFVSAAHPTTYTGKQSFEDFWKTPTGRLLRAPQRSSARNS